MNHNKRVQSIILSQVQAYSLYIHAHLPYQGHAHHKHTLDTSILKPSPSPRSSLSLSFFQSNNSSSFTLSDSHQDPTSIISVIHRSFRELSPGSTELEEGSTTSENDVFPSIWYPLPHKFPTIYLHHQDFRDSDQALRYITRYFNCKTIHQSLKSFPNLSKDFIYSNTYVDTH